MRDVLRLPRYHFQLSVIALLAILGVVTAVGCFIAASSQGRQPVAGSPTFSASTPPAPPVIGMSGPWEQLAHLRRELTGAATHHSDVKPVLSRLQAVVAKRQDPAVAESAYNMISECYTLLGDKQAALDVVLAHLDLTSANGREAVAWKLVDSARRESRHGGTFLAAEQLDEFFIYFSGTQAVESALLLAAQIHLEMNDPDAAMEFYRRYIAAYPASPRREFASLCLSNCYNQNGQDDLAQSVMAEWEQERLRREREPTPAPKQVPASPNAGRACAACGD
jgi:hypothetical protein